MINAIIFSKDPKKLLRLLNSIKKYAPKAFNINVLYSAEPQLQDEYKTIMQKKILKDINWGKELSAKNQVMSLANSLQSLTCFFSDSDEFYKDFNDEIVRKTMFDENIFCFSLHLGLDTKFCHLMNVENVIIPLYEDNDIIKWDWTKHYFDFGFPLSTHGNIYRTNEILKMVRKVSFENSDDLENALQMFEYLPRQNMSAFTKSVIKREFQKNNKVHGQ